MNQCIILSCLHSPIYFRTFRNIFSDLCKYFMHIQSRSFLALFNQCVIVYIGCEIVYRECTSGFDWYMKKKHSVVYEVAGLAACLLPGLHVML